MIYGESAFRDSGNCRLPEGVSQPYPKDSSTNPSGRLRVLSAPDEVGAVGCNIRDGFIIVLTQHIEERASYGSCES